MPTSDNKWDSKEPRSKSQEPAVHEDIYEDTAPLDSIPLAVIYQAGVLEIKKWRVRTALLFLAVMGILCIVSVVITPAIEVRVVAMVVWLSSVTIAKRLLGAPATSRVNVIRKPGAPDGAPGSLPK